MEFSLLYGVCFNFSSMFFNNELRDASKKSSELPSHIWNRVLKADNVKGRSSIKSWGDVQGAILLLEDLWVPKLTLMPHCEG